MAKKKKAELSDKQRKRLETLEQQWEKEDYSAWSSSLSVADLRLLLEHFSPARALIQAIAQGQAAEEEEAAPPPMPMAEANLDAALAAARAEAEMLRREVARLDQAVADALAERDAARHALAEREKELARLTAEAKAAQDKIARMEAELRKRQSDLQEAQKEREALVRQIDDLRRQPPLGQAGDVLAFLCDRDDLQKRLGLEGLSRDAEGVVRMVAVLAQKENVVRLLEALGEAAQKRKAPVSPEERVLLEAAVAWLNHNWKSKPYRLILPQVGEKYDYAAHRRASVTPTGETIASVLAPGLQNGAGSWECKPIVMTE